MTFVIITVAPSTSNTSEAVTNQQVNSVLELLLQKLDSIDATAVHIAAVEQKLESIDLSVKERLTAIDTSVDRCHAAISAYAYNQSLASMQVQSGGHDSELSSILSTLDDDPPVFTETSPPGSFCSTPLGHWPGVVSALPEAMAGSDLDIPTMPHASTLRPRMAFSPPPTLHLHQPMRVPLRHISPPPTFSSPTHQQGASPMDQPMSSHALLCSPTNLAFSGHQEMGSHASKWTGVSPTKYKSKEYVLRVYARYQNQRDVGKLAIALAKHTYFGEAVLRNSTFTGRNNTNKLDAKKLLSLREDIRSVFPHMEGEDFDETI